MEALLIKPAAGHTYEETLLNIKKNVMLEDSGAKVHRIRKTQGGSVLIELESIEDSGKLQEAVQAVTGPESNVRDMIPMLKLEIRDLDGVTNEREIREAVAKEIGIERGDLLPPVSIFKTKGTTSQMAVVELLEVDALRLAKKGRIQIGWASNRVRLRANARRCFRCLGYGHNQYVCKGPDRRKACLKCGVDGHKRSECQKETPECFLCKNRDDKCSTEHYAGEGNCPSYREALAAARNKCHRK